MLNTIKILLFLIVTLFIKFSYGSIYIKPNKEIYNIGDKITITWNSNKNVDNATLSYYSIKYDKNIDILANINEENIDVIWEIPEDIKDNDVGYFVIWDNGNVFIEQSNAISIEKINEQIISFGSSNEKRSVANAVTKKGKSKSKNKNENKNINEIKGNNVEIRKYVKNAGTETSKTKKLNKTSTINAKSTINNNVENKSTNSTNSIKSEEKVINKTTIDETKDNKSSNNQTNNGSFLDKLKSNILLIVAGIIIIVIIIVFFVKKYNKSHQNDIPTGKRSIRRFALNNEVVPPIVNYNDTWKSTLTKNKNFGTLTKNKSFNTLNKSFNAFNISFGTLTKSKSLNTLNNNNNNIILDPEAEKLINGDNLITDAEKFARKHGLTDHEWIARKDYIPYREDELEIYEGNRIKVFELYDDLWCYGMNLDHYGTLSFDNEGMFPSSILPLDVITKLLDATKDLVASNNAANTANATETTENIENNEDTESIESTENIESVENIKNIEPTTNVNNIEKIDSTDSTKNNEVSVEGKENTKKPIPKTPSLVESQPPANNLPFTIPKPLAVPLMPPKALPHIPQLKRGASLRSSVHRKRCSNVIDPARSPLMKNAKRVSQLSNVSQGQRVRVTKRNSENSNISGEHENNGEKITIKQKHRSSFQNKIFKNETKADDAKALLGSDDFPNKSAEESVLINLNNRYSNVNKILSVGSSASNENNDDNSDNNKKSTIERKKEEIHQQKLIIQKQREQLKQQQLQQQQLQQQLKQQKIQQQLQQQQIQKQLQQLQQLQQAKERQLQQQKQQFQEQFQQQQLQQQQLRIQREKQQIIQKSKLKEIEFERERILNESMNKINNRDSILPSYSEAVNSQTFGNYASSSNVEGFPLPPNLNNTYLSQSSDTFVSPVLANTSMDMSMNMSMNMSMSQDLYQRGAPYNQMQYYEVVPEDFPRSASRKYVEDHPSIGRKIKHSKSSGGDYPMKGKYANENLNY